MSMEVLKFDCPPELAQKFWAMCNARKKTSGEMLRQMMVHEIEKWNEAMKPSRDVVKR